MRIAGWPHLVLMLSACTSDAVQAPPEPLPVDGLRVQKSATHTVQRRYSGRVRAGRDARLGFERGGRVLRLRVDRGDEVRAGQVLAELDLARLVTEKRQLEASLRQVRAQVELAERTADRVGALAAKSYASQQSRDESALQLESLRARAAEIEVGIQRVGVELSKSVLTSPFHGRVTTRHVDEGTVVDAGGPVFSIQGSSEAEAEIGLPVRRAQALLTGKHYSLVWRDQRISAPFVRRVDQVQPGSRTVTAIFELPMDGEWVPEEIIELEWAETIEEPGTWVPSSALAEGPRGSWVLYAVRDAKVGLRAVEVLHSRGDEVFVAGTISEDEVIIPSGLHRVVPGQVVQVRFTEGATVSAGEVDR